MTSHKLTNEKILGSTYLSTALDNIEGAHCHVSETAGKNSSDHALGIVAGIVDVAHLVVRFI